MQLKLRRSQRDGGIIARNVIFCLDARVEFTSEEQRHITRYKLQNEVIYNSEESQAISRRTTGCRTCRQAMRRGGDRRHNGSR